MLLVSLLTNLFLQILVWGGFWEKPKHKLLVLFIMIMSVHYHGFRSIVTHRLGSIFSFGANNCWQNRRNKEALKVKVQCISRSELLTINNAANNNTSETKEKKRKKGTSQINLPLLKERVYFTGNTDMQQDHNRFIKTRIIKALCIVSSNNNSSDIWNRLSWCTC